ncbi:MAG: hypothetical protein LC798_05460 [Chloroflexi bacterium]|nr:hypothetical protein [Chloroflexota bacterium]
MPEETMTETTTVETTETEELGDAGQKALEAFKSRARAAEKAQKLADKRATDLEARLAQFDEASKTEQEKAIEAARKEAATAATAEATTRANRRILTAEIKAAAGTKLADPADAVRLLDLDSFDVDDDGEVDSNSIASAIEDLLKAKPYLAADARRAVPSVDGGARPNGSPPVDDSPRGLITAGLQANEAARKR